MDRNQKIALAAEYLGVNLETAGTLARRLERVERFGIRTMMGSPDVLTSVTLMYTGLINPEMTDAELHEVAREYSALKSDQDRYYSEWASAPGGNWVSSTVLSPWKKEGAYIKQVLDGTIIPSRYCQDSLELEHYKRYCRAVEIYIATIYLAHIYLRPGPVRNRDFTLRVESGSHGPIACEFSHAYVHTFA